MKITHLLATLSISFLLFNCGGQQKSISDEDGDKEASIETTEEQTAVCILDRLAVRESPTGKGKYLTSISIGENVTYLGESALDSVDERNYMKIRLLDGTEGWSLEDFIVPNGIAAVFTGETEVYKRPDLLTKADKKYSPMDIVAIAQKDGDWFEVKGKRTEGKYIESGWVKNSSISEDAVDIAVAKFAKSALSMENPDEKYEAIMEIVNNPDLSKSSFISDLRDQINEMQDMESVEMEEEFMDEDTALSVSDVQ